MAGVEPRLRGLASWIEDEAARVLEVGSRCALGGDAAWDAVLRELGVTPLPAGERQKHLAEGPKRARGASPIEVRWAIQAVFERARGSLRPMDYEADTAEENALVRKIEQRLYSLVEDVTREHIRRVAPPAPAASATASIFANARATTPKYGGGVAAGLNQMKCTTCGAPRKAEARGAHEGEPSAVGPCVYCGGALAY
jgi:hypothetical protein